MADSPSHVILDPSFLFSDEALEWIGNPELAQYLVVSEALWSRMEDPQALAEELERFGAPIPDPGVIEMVREAINAAAITKFSYERASADGELEDGTEEVCRGLFANEEPLADALADEWAFVTSQSLAALGKRAGQALGAFSRAGASVIGVVKEKMIRTLEEARESLPPGLLGVMKQVDGGYDRSPKLLLIGGGIAAGIFVPPLGIGMQVAELVLAGNAVLAGDP